MDPDDLLNTAINAAATILGTTAIGVSAGSGGVTVSTQPAGATPQGNVTVVKTGLPKWIWFAVAGVGLVVISLFGVLFFKSSK